MKNLMKIGKNIIPNHAIKSAAMEYMDKVDRDNKPEEMVWVVSRKYKKIWKKYISLSI